MSVTEQIKTNPLLKKIAMWLLITPGQHKPRIWIKLLVNPFKHKRGKGSVIRYKTRIDVFPYNQFNLGERSVIEDFSTVNNGVGDVLIGDRTIIGMSNVIIGPVTIGNDVMFAQNIVVSGLNHGYEDVTIPPSQQKTNTKPIVIGDNVWVGANCVITAGITLGKHVIIGGGSVVTKDVPDYSVAVGNPAKVIKKFNFEKNIWEKV